MNSGMDGLDIDAVITSYNQGAMIFEAVQSLQNQTIPPKRIIIVDDGSSDKFSLDVLQNIETSEDLTIPTKVYHQNNGGVSSARNTGIKQQRNMYWFLTETIK